MEEIRSSRLLFGERQDAFYDVLEFVEPGLMLDVGAAAGAVTSIVLARSPSSRVVAFEPFPGNHPFIEKRVGGDPRVTIVKAAVADQVEPSTFLVGKTVTGSEPGWSNFVGYSSLGYVVPESGADPSTTITVPTARIDDYVDSEGARLLKMDVQGGELGVLKSAARSLDLGRIDLLFVEFGGELDVLEFMLDMDIVVFDSEYLLIPRDDADLRQWHTFRRGTLSTGAPFWRGWPVDPPTTAQSYCEMFKAQKRALGAVYTDLVGVRAEYLATYLDAAQLAATKYGSRD